MMWLEDKKRILDDSDDDSDNSGDEIPIWVRGEQRWVSGIIAETTCEDVINVLLQDEGNRGRHISTSDQYHITERWRGVEQPLDPKSSILDIWNAWGRAQPEVKISLRRVKNDRPPSRRVRCRSDSSTWSDRSAFRTIHPKRLHALQNEKQPSSTEELLKLVLAQGEVIRRQLKKLRNNEQQIGFFEDKTHRARVRKHGTNYLLEAYLKGLPDPVQPPCQETLCADKNSDSGVMTEGDSEQSNNKPSGSAETSFERFSPSSEEFVKETGGEEEAGPGGSEALLHAQVELLEAVARLNRRLLKEEEALVRLDANLRKYDKHKAKTEEVAKALSGLRTEMTKSACEMQHNEVVLEETTEALGRRRQHLDTLYRDLAHEDREHEMLQALLYTSRTPKAQRKAAGATGGVAGGGGAGGGGVGGAYHHPHNHLPHQTKELLDTLV